jgi:hypothetical protein
LGSERRITYLLAALSQACHYHPYELAPTAAELTSWLDQLVTHLQAASPCALAGTIRWSGSRRGDADEDHGYVVFESFGE